MTKTIEPDPVTGKPRKIAVTYKSLNLTILNQRMKVKEDEYRRKGLTKEASSPYLREWLDRWLEDVMKPQLKPRTLKTYSSQIETCIKPSIGGVRLRKLEPKHFRMLEKYVTSDHPEKKVRARSTATAQHAYQCLRKALKDAVAEGLLDTNPADKVTPPRVTAQEVRILTPGQAMQQIDTEGDRMRKLMWKMAYVLGLRQGERLGSIGSEIIYIDGVVCIRVEWQLQWIPKAEFPASIEHRSLGGSAYLTRPKSKAGVRVLPIPPALAVELLSWIEDNHIGPDDLIFTRNGKPISHKVDTNWWNASLEMAHLPKVRVHAARHLAATMMMEAGVPENLRVIYMGHTKEKTTMGYTHASLQDLLQAVTKTNGMIEASTTQAE